MNYRDNARDDAAHAPLRFYRVGAFARWLLVAMALGGAGFFAAMTPLIAKDSWLECERGAAAPDAACTHDEHYPFGLRVRTPLPPLRDARAEYRSSYSRGGPRRSVVLVLEHAGGGTTEYPGVGKSGVRAGEVAVGVSEFLGAGEGTRRWRLREGSVGFAIFALSLALGALVLVPVAFWSTRVSFDPRDRRVYVRRGRWPARAKTASFPIDRFARAEPVGTHTAQASSWSVRLASDDAGVEPADLGISFATEGGTAPVVSALHETLRRWRDGVAA